MKTLRVVFLIVLNVISMSCGNNPLLEAASTPTPTLTLTSTITSTPTLMPTNTHTPTVTITPTPPGGGSGLIAFSSASEGFVIKVVNSEGNVRYTLGTDEEWATGFTWSSDGSKIFYLTLKTSSFSKTSFHRINSDGTNLQDIPTSGDIRSFSFSPDFTKIVYAKGGFGGIPSEIFIADFDGSTVSRSAKLRNGYSPVWSPDGRRIAFMNHNALNLPYQIYVMNANGSGLMNLASPTNRYKSDHNMFPAWSPDGSKIIFSSNREDGIWKIYIMNSDGSNVVKLNDDGNYPSFSPDGRKVIFTSGNGSNISTMNIDGTAIVQLVSCQGYICREPAWAP